MPLPDFRPEFGAKLLTPHLETFVSRSRPFSQFEFEFGSLGIGLSELTPLVLMVLKRLANLNCAENEHAESLFNRRSYPCR